MNHNRKSAWIPGVAGILALGGFLLRLWTITDGMDIDGLLPRGSSVLAVTVIFSVVGMGLLTLLCLGLNRLPGREDCFSASPLWLGPELLAGLLLTAGSLLHVTAPPEAFDRARALGEQAGVWMGVLLICTALFRKALGKNVFWLRILPAIWTVAGMILRFRSWTQDPLIIRLAPALLAVVCDMLSFMLLSGFPLNAGHRRSTVLFGFGAAFFTLMALPDYLLGLAADLPELFILLGMGLWSLVHACMLLRRPVQDEVSPSPEASESAAEA